MHGSQDWNVAFSADFENQAMNLTCVFHPFTFLAKSATGPSIALYGMRASRKRRRADGRQASPPLAPAPLAQRSLQLLPVGLTQLPNDADFVRSLQADVEHLLFGFAQECLVKLVSQRDSPTSMTPFAVFTQLYVQSGWHLAQFCFGDHHDTKRDFGHTICRVFLQTLPVDKQVFANLRDLFRAVGVPFALYTYWYTQQCPDSGIGVKPNSRDMATIPIEQDVYDWLLQLPRSVLEQLEAEPVSRPHAHAIVSELAQVLVRLCGRPDVATSSKGKRTQDVAQNMQAVLDVIPATRFETRRPRIWPSVQIMSTREADKQFGRVGKVVRIQDTEAASGTSASETVTGLSRGDLVRIRARQRLDWALADLPELQPTSPQQTDTSTIASSSKPGKAQIQTAPKGSRYEVEVSPWISKSKSTAKLRPWLDATSAPLEDALDRLSQSRSNYELNKAGVMSMLYGNEQDECPDFSSSLIESFIARARGQDAHETSVPAVDALSSENTEDVQTVQQLYQQAARQTRDAIMAISNQIDSRTDQPG